MIDFASHYEFIPFSWGFLKFCAALGSLLTFHDEFNIGVVSILWPEMVPNKNLKKKKSWRCQLFWTNQYFSNWSVSGVVGLISHTKHEFGLMWP